MRNALDTAVGLGIVYTYVRPNWQDNANTVRQMIDANGGLHPKSCSCSMWKAAATPRERIRLDQHLYNNSPSTPQPARILGYANQGDFNSMWPSRPKGLRVIARPTAPTRCCRQIAHQYTDGSKAPTRACRWVCPFVTAT